MKLVLNYPSPAVLRAVADALDEECREKENRIVQAQAEGRVFGLRREAAPHVIHGMTDANGVLLPDDEQVVPMDPPPTLTPEEKAVEMQVPKKRGRPAKTKVEVEVEVEENGIIEAPPAPKAVVVEAPPAPKAVVVEAPAPVVTESALPFEGDVTKATEAYHGKFGLVPLKTLLKYRHHVNRGSEIKPEKKLAYLTDVQTALTGGVPWSIEDAIDPIEPTDD